MAAKDTTPEERARKLAWYWRNREKALAYQRARSATPEGKRQAAARMAKWRLRHADRRMEHINRYRSTFKGQLQQWSCYTVAKMRKAFVKRTDGRLKKMPGCSVMPKEMRDLWYSQDGKCALTGWPFILHAGTPQLNSPSVDRINPKEGYHMGNIRLVTWQANAAKHFGSDDDLIAFCRAVLAHLA